MAEDVLDTKAHREDDEESLRPASFDEYVGQNDLKENLRIFVSAAKKRDESLDHVLLYGPPGLGKTTMAMIIAHEMGAGIKIVTAPAIDKTGDLVAILTSLSPGDVLFIDEIHRLNKVVEEVLYPAMEDYCVDVMIGKETPRSVRIDLPPFTLVGATTRAGDLSAPLRDRFGIVSKLDYYNDEDLTKIISRTSRVYDFAMDDDAKYELARRSRGTPRIANRLFRRVRDFAQFYDDDHISLARTQEALDRLKVDNLGLDDVDRRYLLGIINRYGGGPVGLDALAASIGEESVTLEDVYEPYLLQKGLVKRTHRGRIATQLAYDHFHITREFEE
ncbi:Holliday junction branch migration DNA helicase RuvB [Intestinibaculum porci]|jgi:Holliday junction DNA helicase RuvB|uniref:Holliday junction branch migration complex subunit RuvB n=1 Tax=Intestinibaculum porci TaxID=2487118 RepID=A0A3G9JPD9_9FIRM|nr:Holliday junction branch migration DNA helicase RuvB [Intestinibaculum porci]MDD6348608.1 Holliday junction branch migration DNA helicase RuvB [Intestinibaculum porci]MDD6423802.1 Holliday junction branch migration DNA helicase RuvB [Intestinibaculum porci]BBH26108.1 Holliday junction ATP-dependent DNA helicase RuvB [Intestinibaculum porci]HAN58276.1 Holliday junction branch migration DNA helicase RuvB [Erysipelotrichaceae bacterium]